ncbi:hypothetical protein [Rhodococcus jostii]|uniref:hypothetical protein n=1 Tax=Rhodococcus jostii TaxID=132919 RepID=UPI00363710A3
MTEQDTTLSRPRRKLRRVPVAVGLAAVVVVSVGAGIGTAATADLGSPATAVGWSVTNYTDQDLTDGAVRKKQTDNASVINLYGGLARGETRTGSFEWDPDGSNETSARICYNRQLWETPYVLTKGDEWRDVFIYAPDDGKGGKKLLLTRRGAYDNRLLNNTHISC